MAILGMHVRFLGCKFGSFLSYVPGSICQSTPYIGDGHPTLNDGNPFNGYVKAFYWVDKFIPYHREPMGVWTPAHIEVGICIQKGPNQSK